MDRNTIVEMILVLIREIGHENDNELLLLAKIEELLARLKREEEE